MTATEQETEQELDSLELTKRSSLGGISFPSLFFIWAILGISPFILFHWLTQSYLRVIAWPWMLAWQAGFILIILLGVGILRYFRVPPQLLGYGLDWFVCPSDRFIHFICSIPHCGALECFKNPLFFDFIIRWTQLY